MGLPERLLNKVTFIHQLLYLPYSARAVLHYDWLVFLENDCSQTEPTNGKTRKLSSVADAFTIDSDTNKYSVNFHVVLRTLGGRPILWLPRSGLRRGTRSRTRYSSCRPGKEVDFDLPSDSSVLYFRNMGMISFLGRHSWELLAQESAYMEN